MKRVGRPNGWLELPRDRPTDAAVKPAAYLPIYEQLMAHMRTKRFALLELGVWEGHSLEMWRDSFPRATIIGVDVSPPDLALGPRVHIIRGDQADAQLIAHLRERLVPQGFGAIIDDASHLGVKTAQSLQILFAQHLQPGGLYCIEDWGTGYWPSWPDGGEIRSRLDADCLDSSPVTMHNDGGQPVPLPSHDLGVVGLIKRLVDHAARDTVRMADSNTVGDPLEIDSMTIWNGIVAIRKCSV